LAAEILGEAIEDNDKEEKSEQTNSEEESEVKKNPHAQELGRLRGLKVDKARVAKLLPKRHQKIVRTAAKPRWKKSD
jgi:hypothetical protein